MRKRFGTMIDCSRNGVMKVETVKKWIDLISDLGYNTFLMYMEDTYEVDDNPYFGYGRGRYSKDELKEIDKYASGKGIEVIPCIQTLSHMNVLVECPAYESMVDCNDILLIGDERVYALIDNMFKTMSECLSTKHINVGMDEAYMVGRGKYYDINGASNRSEVLVGHVKKVAEIAKKYGFNISMWSDMFFRMTSSWESYSENPQVPQEVKDAIPENVELVFWNYSNMGYEWFDNRFKQHNAIKEGTWFAGGFWTWQGFAPNNKYALKALGPQLDACENNKTQNIFFTIWGDDGNECSKFASLPSLFYTAEVLKGNKDVDDIKKKFKEKFDIDFDDFLVADLNINGTPTNTSKCLFYNDLFSGRIDTIIRDEASAEFAEMAERISKFKNHKEFGYIFKPLTLLAEIASIKADLANSLREAYLKNDKETLKVMVGKCKTLVEKYNLFYDAYRIQWFTDNKASGFDVQDIRIGGIIKRTEHCTKRLDDFISGKISKIEELEEERLDFRGKGKDYEKGEAAMHSMRKIFSANRLSW